MQRIAYFPATSCNPAPQPISKHPVLKIDQKRTLEADGSTRNTARLSIDPWDLHAAIVEANRLGLQGKEVEGFGYADELQAIVFSFKR